MMIFLLDWAASYIASYYEPLFIEFTSRLPVDFALMERAANSGYRYVTVGVGTDGEPSPMEIRIMYIWLKVHYLMDVQNLNITKRHMY